MAIGEAGVKKGIDCGGEIDAGDVNDEEVAEIVGEGEGLLVVGIDAGGEDVVLGVCLKVPDCVAHRFGIEGTYFDKAESEVVEVVIQVAFGVKTGTKAQGIVEIQAENLSLKAAGAVIVYQATDETAAGNAAYNLEIAQSYAAGALLVHPADKGPYQNVVHTPSYRS